MRHHDDPETRAGFALLTTFGLGYLRPASGTWGSLPPVALAGALILAGLGPADAPWVYHATLLLVALVFSGACVAFGDQAEARFGEDPSEVVADETAGQCIPLMLIPTHAIDTLPELIWVLGAAFLLFRALDILKPPPAYTIQRVPGGWGVLLDDLVAGAYAFIGVQVLVHTVLA